MKNQAKIENPMAYARASMVRKAQAETQRNDWRLGNRFDFTPLETKVRGAVQIGR